MPDGGAGRGSIAYAIEEYPARRRELQQEVEFGEVGGQEGETELLRLQEQDAVVERLEPGVLGVTLLAGEDAGQERGPTQDFGVGGENPMIGHGFDLIAHRRDHGRRAAIGRIEDADSVHQLLDRHRRVIDLPCADELLDEARRPSLHLIDVDASIE